MRIKSFLACVGAGAVLAVASQASAGPIPYPNSGTPNPVVYTFTAQTTGDVVAYFAGSGASYDNQLGLLVNGVDTGITGLDNHTSSLGQSLDFGTVQAGSTLTFVLNNLSLKAKAYSDPSLNVAYDNSNDTVGHNHIYSTSYTGGIAGIPAGTYVAFEDLPFPGADFNYNDETFVFTNTAVSTVSAAPEPSMWLLLMAGIGGIGLMLRQGRKVSSPRALSEVSA